MPLPLVSPHQSHRTLQGNGNALNIKSVPSHTGLYKVALNIGTNNENVNFLALRINRQNDTMQILYTSSVHPFTHPLDRCLHTLIEIFKLHLL